MPFAVTCFNKAFEIWECECEQEGGRKAKLTKSRLLDCAKNWTLQEWLAIANPYCAGAAVILILTIFRFEQNIPSLIYSSLPENSQTRFWFTLLFLQEANQLFYSLHSMSFIFQLHILLPGKLSKVLKVLASDESVSAMDVKKDKSSFPPCSSAARANWIIGQIRVVLLMMNLFNIGHRNVIYCVKLLAITVATVNGYGAIAHGQGNLAYLLMSSCCACNVNMMYVFVYQTKKLLPFPVVWNASSGD